MLDEDLMTAFVVYLLGKVPGQSVTVTREEIEALLDNPVPFDVTVSEDEDTLTMSFPKG